MNQTLRIIGGRYRGKKIEFPDVPGLRPTTDRVRETLFNWLMNDIFNAHCLDACAGSGALGLEAFSRGAKAVTFIENNSLAFKSLQQTLAKFATPCLKVHKKDIQNFLTTGEEIFDIIFFDPPFAQLSLLDCLNIVSQKPILRPHGLLYLETPTEVPLPMELWDKLKLKKAGEVTYGLYRKKA